jgi:hypothetical protein
VELQEYATTEAAMMKNIMRTSLFMPINMQIYLNLCLAQNFDQNKWAEMHHILI